MFSLTHIFLHLRKSNVLPVLLPGILALAPLPAIPGGNHSPGADTAYASAEDRICMQLQGMSEDRLVLFVDSLLDQEWIDMELLDEIKYYVQSNLHNSPAVPEMHNPYPAHYIYGTWDTRESHPYNEELSASDTTLMLVLGNDTSRFVQPVVGPITSYYGYRDGRNHNGIDIDLHVWDEVVAAFDGVVRIARVDGGYGRLVVVRHFNGLETFYAHLHRFRVKAGQFVKAGDVVGLGGSSGKSTGSHLHFEMRYKGKPINPKHIISFRDSSLISDSVVLHRNRWSYSAYPSGLVYHTIQRGDCLYNIAKRYGTTISRICELNGIRRNSMLRVGVKLRVAEKG